MPIKKRGGVPKTRRVLTGGYRSTSERRVAESLKALGITPGFESETLEYSVPATRHKYTPDFVLDNGVYLEVKGFWLSADRQKILRVLASNPQADIRLVLDTPDKPVNKGAKMTYADFCNRHGIKWCKTGEIPPDWLHGCSIDPFLIAK